MLCRLGGHFVSDCESATVRHISQSPIMVMEFRESCKVRSLNPSLQQRRSRAPDSASRYRGALSSITTGRYPLEVALGPGEVAQPLGFASQLVLQLGRSTRQSEATRTCRCYRAPRYVLGHACGPCSSTWDSSAVRLDH